MASIEYSTVVKATVHLSVNEAEKELNLLSGQVFPDRLINYVISKKENYDISRGDLELLNKLPKDLFLRCVVAIGQYSNEEAEFIHKSINESNNENRLVAD